MPTPDPKGLAVLATHVADALQAETIGLRQLADHFDAHLAALRAQQQEALETHLLAINEAVHHMEQLRNQRERQMCLLSRLLNRDPDDTALGQLIEALDVHPALRDVSARMRGLHAELHEVAQHAQARSKQLEYALQYAARLGRELIHTLQHLDQPATSRHYTADGHRTANARAHAWVDQVG